MKKITFILLSLFLAFSCHALPLFPFFVDLVGNYNDGPVPELKHLVVECLSSDKCNYFNTIEEADSFLNDVLPYENYSIVKKKLQKDGINMEIYTSGLEDGRTSVIYLIEMPGDGLYVLYDETPGNPFEIE